MKVLCTCLGEYGHFHSMVSLASALRDAGHQVAFATAGPFCCRVERAGFTAFAAGMTLEHQLREASRRFPGAAALPPGPERFVSFASRMLAQVAAPARAADLVPLVRGWRPDVLVHGEAELAGAVVAEAAGIPYVAQSVGVLRPREMVRIAAEELAPLCEHMGLTTDPAELFYRYLYLDVCPPSLQDPLVSEIGVAHPVRPSDFDGDEGAGADPLASLTELSSQPVVYLSLGTIFNRNGGVFASILHGLAREAVTVIVTVGHDGDRAALGDQPSNVRVEGYVPQSLLLPSCDVVVNQAGWSTMAVIAHGLPLLAVPQGANQFHTAEACVAAGMARRLLPAELSPDAVRSSVRTLLDEPGYRRRAREVAREIQAMPGPEVAVGLVERLEREGHPLTRPLPGTT